MDTRISDQVIHYVSKWNRYCKCSRAVSMCINYNMRSGHRDGHDYSKVLPKLSHKYRTRWVSLAEKERERHV